MGAVGFKNGGGNDLASRRHVNKKFRDDLERMLEENPSLPGFVFFTNVDLVPSHRDELVARARAAGISHVEVFDFERLRHVLDQPEGLIARLQYLGVPMSETDQAALISKFGRELQRVVTTRLDRVDRTLGEMERFMAFQKPIFRMEVFVGLNEPCTKQVLPARGLGLT